MDFPQVSQNWHSNYVVKRGDRYGLMVCDYYNTLLEKQVYTVYFFDGNKLILFEHDFERVPEPEATIQLVMNS